MHSKLSIFISLFLLLSSTAFASPTIEISVIANKTEENNSKIPHTVDVISHKKLALQKNATISDMLHQISGLYVAEKGLSGDDLDIRMRGSDRDEVLVLFDGVPIEGNGEARSFFLNMMPVEFIDRVEIIKGAQSVLYGSNAVGGIINIISRNGSKQEPHYFANFAYTTDNSFREALGTSLGNEKTAFNMGVMRDDSKILNHFNDQSDTTGLHLNLNHQVSPGFKVTWGLDTFFGRQNLAYDQINAFGATVNSYVVPDDDIKRKIGWFQSYIKLEAQITERFKSALQIAGNYLTETLANTNAGDSPVDENGLPLDASSQYYLGHSYRIYTDFLNQYRLFKSSNIKDDVQVGISVIHDHLDFINNSYPGDIGAGLPSTDSYPSPGEKSGRENYSFYFQNLFYWNNFTLTTGARIDHNTTFGSEWSPRVAASYEFKKTSTTIRASYSEGFHAPTIAEFFDATIGSTVTALSLKRHQETTQSYEAGIEQNLFDNKLKLRGTYFYISYNKLLDILEAINSANSWGIENDVSTSLVPKTKLGINYTFNHTHNDDTGKELTMRPHHMLNTYVEMEPIANFTIRPELQYVSRRKNPETISLTIGDFPVQFFNSKGETSTYTSSHTALNLLLNYKWINPTKNLKAVNLYAKGTNLFNSRYDNNYGYPVNGFRVTFGSNFEF
ncbi:TonB-dependent receptor [bacterium]|nr:TonB-dependent receptor [bacterium]